MFTLLVVDDEEYALLGMTQGIDWTGLEISRVLTATSFDEALRVLQTDVVDVIISDIEMPGKSGIDLLEWVQANCPDTPTIFLTGHANFQYARKALQYGCVEYLLKPVDYAQLVDVVKKALEQRQYEKDRKLQVENYKEYKSLWENQKPTFISHLWRDIMQGRLPGDSRRIRELFGAMDIAVEPSQQVMLILIKVEQWLERMDLRDREVMRFAVRNVASETLLDGFPGIVFQILDDSQMAVLYDLSDPESVAEVVRKAELFIETCNRHLACHLSCYIAAPTELADVSGTYKELLRQEQENLTKPNSVLRLQDFKELSSSTLKAPDFPE